MARRVFFEIQSDATRRILLLTAALVGLHVAIALAGAWFVARLWPTPGAFDFYAPRFALCAVALALFEAHLFPRGRMERLLTDLKAKPLDTGDFYHRRLANVLRELEIATPLGRIEGLVAASPGRNVLALSVGGRNLLVVSEGLVSRLPRDGLAAVLAHAAARIVWGDARVGTLLAAFAEPIRAVPLSVFGAVADSILALQGEGRDLRADATAVAYLGDPFPLARAIDCVAEDPYLAEVEAGYRPMLFFDAARAEERLAVLSELAGHPVSNLVGRPARDFPRATPEAGAGNDATPVSATAPPRASEFRLYWAGAWLGPFSPQALLAHELFTWDAWVFRQGDAVAAPASFVEELLAAAHGPSKKNRPRDPVCPACRAALAPRVREGARIFSCPGCEGILLTSETLLREILRRDEVPPPEAVAEAARIAARSESVVPVRRTPAWAGRPCPRCARPMLEGPLQGVYDSLRVERCLGCDVLWFERGELTVAEALVERRAP